MKDSSQTYELKSYRYLDHPDNFAKGTLVKGAEYFGLILDDEGIKHPQLVKILWRTNNRVWMTEVSMAYLKSHCHFVEYT